MPDNGGYESGSGPGYSWQVRRDKALAEAELSGRVIELHPDPPRPLHEYGLGPETEQLRRRADELREQLEDLAAHLRELGEAHQRMQELLAGILEELQ